MNVSLLNQMVEALEACLTTKPDYHKIASRLGLSEFIMQRVFAVVAGMSMSEYLRRRRLSAAYAELKTTETKIIDIAIKYGWQNPTAFARAFRKEFGCSPSACRASVSTDFRLFPMLEFSDHNKTSGLTEYRIEKLNNFVIYGYEVAARTHKKLSVAINDFYDQLRLDGRYDQLNKHGRWALSYPKDGLHHYLVGSAKKLPDATTKYQIQSGTYAVFEVKSKKQSEIIRTINFAEGAWERSTGHALADLPILEKYEADNCWLYVPLN